jgi:phage terminase large subunit-like protein
MKDTITPTRGESTPIRLTIINMSLSLKKRVSLLPKEKRDAWIREQPDWLLKEIARNEWWWTSRPEQIPPDGDWLVHLALAGRGWGKSMAGSEWLVERCRIHPFDKAGTPTEWLVIAETLSDARLICLEGPAGILRVLDRRQIKYRYIKSPKPMILLPEGSKIYCEGADSEDVGRGYNASGCWLDEIAKWKKPRESWYNGIMPSLRADLYGDHPRAFVTTTPKPIELIREWLKREDGTVSIVRGSTFENADNLSTIVVNELRTRYEGTAIGRQELYGEMLDLFDNALFSAMDIERNRVDDVPDEIVSIVVGVDPNLTGEEDEMGVVVVARTKDNHHYVLSDQSSVVTGRAAALHCWHTVAQYGADVMVYENNLGKAWMAQVLRDAYMELVGQGLFPEGTSPPMKSVDSKLGKKTRAEPVAMRYQQGKVHHVGVFRELENQLINYDFTSAKDSPDRLDALVHACRHLMLAEKKIIRMATPVGQPLYVPTDFEGSYFG